MWWRTRARRRGWLEGWEAVAADQLRQWDELDDAERARLGGLVEWMVTTKHWEAARGFELTQEVVIAVAASASLLVLHLDRRAYRDVRAVVVHPRTITRHGPQATGVRGVVADGPRRLLGHAVDRRGPVVVSWPAVRRDLRHPRAPRNVVLHEFAHKLDAADGLFDGTPEITDPEERAAWVRVCTAEYRRHRSAARPLLGGYAGRSPSEFFAVATEVFFCRPVALEDGAPALYDVLRRYYRQDPATRWRRRHGDDEAREALTT